MCMGKQCTSNIVNYFLCIIKGYHNTLNLKSCPDSYAWGLAALDLVQY